ncbi:MAG TPA: XRE family transcriptional regulator [Puia sp.]|jgi:transcriptional regulator with XRE-family HTH domain|nr:XRE family transcriptional regulator [Puia sp.]
MNEELILLLGDKIKTKRTQKNITLEQLAGRAGVSKGLISQIENNRTVPSLPVLFNIIHSLDEDLKTFFEDMHDSAAKGNILIIRKGQEKLFEKEPVRGFSYKRILTRSVATQAADVVLLELKKGAVRKQMITTDAFECKHVLKGTIEYQIDKEVFVLYEGDTLFFDGRTKHKLKNVGPAEAVLLVIYLF